VSCILNYTYDMPPISGMYCFCLLVQIADIGNMDSGNRGRVGENSYFVWVTTRKYSWV